MLGHVKEAGDSTNEDANKEADQKDSADGSHKPMYIGAGLPPVPKKLVQRIQSGEYVDMSELLPDRLGINAGPPVELSLIHI